MNPDSSRDSGVHDGPAGGDGGSLSALQDRILELAVLDTPLRPTLAAIVTTVEQMSPSGLLASVLITDEDGAHLRHGAGPSLPDEYNRAIDGIAIGQGVGSCGTAAFTKTPVYVADIANDPLWADFRELALSFGLRACWSTPIISSEGDVVGTFAMYYREPREPNAEDLALVAFVARAVGLIIERKSADERQRVSDARSLFLSELDEALRRATDAPAAMQSAATLLGRYLGASRCAYADVDSDGDGFNIRADYTASGVASSAGTYSLDLFGPRAAADMRAGQVLVICDVEAELSPGEGRETFRGIGIEAIICCPLLKDGMLAAMMAVHQTVARAWHAEEIALVEAVVERCWSHVERIGSEARLRESEERLRLATENAEVGFWDVDPINDVLVWPARTKAMFGISPDVPVSMTDFYDGLHPDDRAATSDAYAGAADPTRRALYDVEYRTVGKEDGIIRWVAAKGRGVFDANGRCVRVAGTAVDITARKHAEERLRELNETLEARVAERTAELEAAHEQLRQSQKLEAMGSLTGGVAHDFNNLLTPIVGALDMLQRRGLGGEREQRLIAGAAQSADRATTLVQRLLAFARRQPLRPVAVDLSQLVRNMADLVSSTTGPQITVVVDAPNGLPPAKADPNQLEMALLNLSVNARDAMPDGGTLRISASECSTEPDVKVGLKAGRYLCLSVADTGAGMDEATLARAIEPFFSTKGVGKGTGLGLSMVHGLASQLGGALKISSQPGLGTNIELWLPHTDMVPDAPSPAAEIASVQGRGTVLLVDDEEFVRLSTADMLADLGYDVVEAVSAEEALRLLETGIDVDLAVTDHLMPGMTGTDLAYRIRDVQPELPVLVVSGYAEADGMAPDVPRLTKPFRKDELAASIATLVPASSPEVRPQAG